jgi:hypothetical protein
MLGIVEVEEARQRRFPRDSPLLEEKPGGARLRVEIDKQNFMSALHPLCR